MNWNSIDWYQIFIIAGLFGIGYILEKIHELLIEWKVNWDEKNNPEPFDSRMP